MQSSNKQTTFQPEISTAFVTIGSDQQHVPTLCPSVLPPPLLLPPPDMKVNQYYNELMSKHRSNFKNKVDEMLNKHPPVQSIDPSLMANRIFSQQQLKPEDKSSFIECPTCGYLIRHLQFQFHQECHATDIGNGLYLGSATNSSNLKQLKRLNIGAILNCATEVPNTFTHQANLIYKKLPLTDFSGESMKQYFNQCIQFIHQHLNNKKKILVHCAMGRSRSVAIVLLYLMMIDKMTLRQAYELVKTRRSIIMPNPTYVKQLLELELETYGSNSINISQIKVQPNNGLQ